MRRSIARLVVDTHCHITTLYQPGTEAGWEKVEREEWNGLQDELQGTGAKLAVWSDKISREAVALAHQRGLKVWVYTINDAQAANKLLDMGVDGIITNNPSLIWKTIALRGAKVS